MVTLEYIAKDSLWIMFWCACLITLIVGIVTDQAHALICLSACLSVAVVGDKLIKRAIEE